MIYSRYIFTRIAKVFGVILLLTYSIMMILQVHGSLVFARAVEIDLGTFVAMTVYSSTGVFFILIPISLALATYIQLKELSQDFEVAAFRASGISLLNLSLPIFFLSSGVAVLLLFITHFLAPFSLNELDKMRFKLIQQVSTINLSPKTFNEIGDKIIYVEEVEGNQLNHVFIADAENPDKNIVIYSQQALYNFSTEKGTLQFRFFDGEFHSKKSGAEGYQVFRFREFDYPIAMKQKLDNEIDARYFKDPKTERDITKKPVFLLRYHELKSLLAKKEMPDTEKKSYIIEFLFRCVAPASCLALTFLVIPFGIPGPRSHNRFDYFKLLAIYLSYIVSMMFFDNLINIGALNPFFFAFIPLVAFSIGIILLFMKNKDLELSDLLSRKK